MRGAEDERSGGGGERRTLSVCARKCVGSKWRRTA